MLRALTYGIILFWAVMTSLLIRYTYFPEGSQFAKVPPQLVLKMFLEQGASLNTLHLYHNGKKLGYASITQRRNGADTDKNGHVIQASGLIEKGMLQSVEGQVAWRLDFKIAKLSEWLGSSGQVRLPETGMVLDFDWSPAERLPKFLLKQQGLVIADEKMIQPMMMQLLGPGPAAELAQGKAGGENIADLVELKAREGSMVFSGQKRKGYVLEFGVMSRWKAKAFFTEAGELALVDLPEGYRLVEPVIHGLAPDYEDEEEGAAE